MAKIIGLDEMSVEEVYQELSKGAKFVVFLYCFSIVILTFKRSSSIYFIKSGEVALTKGIKYTLISLFLGWWGIPWGIIYTIQSIFVNFRGGKDVTLQVMSALRQN
ncbi:MAG: hypothetical protein IGS49_01055 [Chlorogloeopsis fritschii C42_A2020_084]|uniref:hypothetical protein n=1 Tax=Chlorogloeopsis fritschii TaxID=1124 RepID=UPI0019DDAC39|nr:hypothetical protein [Chlorogloeopsis fritschii]MBF2004085.1 hypothetical protein [Chlorogloeopsis fritschii C42_A2020_084]